jgi:drug/metabolite transporter (DMT)-like permease
MGGKGTERSPSNKTSFVKISSKQNTRVDVGNRGIGRARMFMGALLLLAAALTWGIGLMMSPHGESVARGTEYLRTTVVTFKRNGATGTLILCAIAAWLLFPKRRPKWPMRDWALIVLFAFLAGSSIYTRRQFCGRRHEPELECEHARL